MRFRLVLAAGCLLLAASSAPAAPNRAAPTPGAPTLISPGQSTSAQAPSQSSAGTDSVIQFRDSFTGRLTQLPNGSQKLYPDPSVWAFNFWPGSVWPDSYGDGTNWLAGNGESQVYLSPYVGKVAGQTIPLGLRYDPFSIQPDGLHIRAQLLSPDQQAAYQVGGHRRFGSGILRQRESFTYGRIRLVAKLPNTKGSWPAFWLLPKAQIWPPEIDIFEGMVWGHHTTEVHMGLVTPKSEGGTIGLWKYLGVNPSQDFHEYGLDWTPQKLTFLFDGRVMFERPTPPSMQQPMYLLINLAVGGKWPCNELEIEPIDDMSPERLNRCANSFEAGCPTDLVLRSVRVEKLTP